MLLQRIRRPPGHIPTSIQSEARDRSEFSWLAFRVCRLFSSPLSRSFHTNWLRLDRLVGNSCFGVLGVRAAPPRLTAPQLTAPNQSLLSCQVTFGGPGLCPPLAPECSLCKGVNVPLTRTKEIQEIHTHVFAGLADAQEDQVFLNAFWSG